MIEEKRKLKVALDLDGVIWDLVSLWVSRYNEKYGDNISPEDVVDYDVSKTMTKASRGQLFDLLSEDHFWDDVQPFEEAEEFLYKLNEEYELYIATKTYYGIFGEKISRFIKLFPFIGPDQVICIGNKQLLDVDYLVDDCIDNLVGGKYDKIIIDAPYNRTADLCFIRAKNLRDVYNYLKGDE